MTEVKGSRVYDLSKWISQHPGDNSNGIEANPLKILKNMTNTYEIFMRNNIHKDLKTYLINFLIKTQIS